MKTKIEKSWKQQCPTLSLTAPSLTVPRRLGASRLILAKSSPSLMVSTRRSSAFSMVVTKMARSIFPLISTRSFASSALPLTSATATIPLHSLRRSSTTASAPGPVRPRKMLQNHFFLIYTKKVSHIKNGERWCDSYYRNFGDNNCFSYFLGGSLYRDETEERFLRYLRRSR